VAGRVVILGSVNVDLVATTSVLPSPGATVVASSFVQTQGGKGANQAIAASRAGASVHLFAAVGTDAFGDTAIEALATDGVDVEHVRRVDLPTGVAIVLVDEAGENEIVIARGANEAASGTGFAWQDGDIAAAVLEVRIEAVREFFVEARSGGAMTLLNAAPPLPGAASLLHLADVVCANETEAAALVGTLRNPAVNATIIVTLGSGGARIEEDDDVSTIPGIPVRIADTVGAGDTFCGVLAARLAAGDPVREAARIANKAAAISVTRAGARGSPTSSEMAELCQEVG
jgi:ribokinase